jgi:hypothetical protein
VAGGHDGIGLAVLDEVHRDEDRRVLLLAQGEGRVFVHADDLTGRHDRDVGRKVSGDGADGRLVTDEDDPVLGMGPGVIEGAGDDLSRAVVATHRVDRHANPGGEGRRLGSAQRHRVSARRRQRQA